MNATDLVGWLASACLLATIGTQVVRQWQSGRVDGVSPWLFVGQMTASAGFVVYSALVGSTVFVVTNSALLVAAIVGLLVYLRAKNDRPAITTDDDRETLPIPTAPAVLSAILAEPTHDTVSDDPMADPLATGVVDLRVDLVVSPRDTIGVDPVHRVAS